MTDTTQRTEAAYAAQRKPTETSCEKQPAKDFVQYVTEYAREKPDVAALWCFGVGFVLGWKLKPW